MLHQKLHEPSQPLLVITHAKVFGRRNEFDLKAPRVDVPFVKSPHRTVQGIRARFPAFMKHRLILLILNRAEALHPTHVMDAVHALAPALVVGIVTLVTPIMASRVTKAASSSSFSFSLPSGRSGSTR